MKISLAPQVFALAPEFVRFVLVAENVTNQEENPTLLHRLRELEQQVRDDDTFADLKTHPRLASWRDIFGAFGANANKCPPSVFNLIKRVRGGKDLPFINNLVCIFNILSLEHIMPAGGDDLGTVDGDITLTAAQGHETYIPLGSTKESDTIEHPKPEEIILLDTGSDTVLCRAWCWKNGDTTKITPESSRVAINIDILPPVTRDEGAAIAAKAKELIETHCHATVTIYPLDAQNPSLEV